MLSQVDFIGFLRIHYIVKPLSYHVFRSKTFRVQLVFNNYQESLFSTQIRTLASIRFYQEMSNTVQTNHSRLSSWFVK